MEHKQLGTTGIDVPEIGLGTSRFVGGAEPIRRAVELGAALIDTAELYGTEGIVGDAVHGMRDRVWLATKVHRKHLAYRDVMAAADKSLNLLGTDHIDVYQIHSPHSEIPIACTK